VTLGDVPANVITAAQRNKPLQNAMRRTVAMHQKVTLRTSLPMQIAAGKVQNDKRLRTACAKTQAPKPERSSPQPEKHDV